MSNCAKKGYTSPKIAEIIGTGVSNIRMIRNKNGLSLYKKTQIEWNDDLERKFSELPNTATIKEVASALSIPMNLARRKLEARRGKVYKRLNEGNLALLCILGEKLTVKELAVKFGYSESQIVKLKRKHGIKSNPDNQRRKGSLEDDFVREIRTFDGSYAKFCNIYGQIISGSTFCKIRNGLSYIHVK